MLFTNRRCWLLYNNDCCCCSLIIVVVVVAGEADPEVEEEACQRNQENNSPISRKNPASIIVNFFVAFIEAVGFALKQLTLCQYVRYTS